MPREIEILKPGRFTAMNGQSVTFSAGDLEAAAAAYDAALHEAPIVVGHPKSDAPAYGWAKGLRFENDRLVADADDINQDFAELVRKGSFKKVSASFYSPASKNNPVPGKWYLRHIGFLGAQPPAVKGLKAVELEEAEEGVVELAETWRVGSVIRNLASMFRAVRDMVIEDKGTERADELFPAWRIDDLIDNAARIEAEGDADVTAGLGEHPNPTEEIEMGKDKVTDADLEHRAGELDSREQQLTADREKLETDQKAFAEREAGQRRRENEAFVETLVAEGRLPPGHKDGMLAFMESIHDGDSVEFGEGDGAVKKEPVAYLRDFLSKLPRNIDFSERSADKGDSLEDSDPESVAQAAVAFQEEQRKAGITISADAAVRHVLKEVSR